MAKLKTKQQTMFLVEFQDLNKFVKKLYKKSKYHFVVYQNDWRNNVSYIFSVKPEWSAIDEPETWEKMKSGQWQEEWGNNAVVLTGLCIEGYIDPGEYVVEVCW